MEPVYYYSPNANGFYVDQIHGEAMPVDAVAITTDLYQSLMQAQSAGKRIAPGPDGQPIAADREAIAAPLSVFARAALEASDITLIRCMEAGVPVPQEWRDYRVALRAIATNDEGVTALPPRPAYPPGT